MNYQLHISLLILLIAPPALTVEAQKCHYEVDQVDAETEFVIKRTEPVQITQLNEQPLYVKAQCIGTRKYLKMRYYRYSGFTIDEMLPIEIVFADESKLSLFPREMPGNGAASNGFVKVSSLLVFDLDPNAYNQLLSKPVNRMVFNTSSGQQIEKVIRKRYQSDIQYIMNCVKLDTDN